MVGNEPTLGSFRYLERVGRIELPSVAWEATVLPLYDTRRSTKFYQITL